MDVEFSEDPLVYAALLDWFDEAVLLALLPAASPAITELLSGAMVVPVAGRPGAFTLRDDLRAARRIQLREALSYGEIALWTRAFRVFCDHMRHEESPWHTAAEDLCFSLLAKLITKLYLRLEWQAIKDLVADAAAAGPRQPRYLRRLTVYEASVAVRTGEQAHGGRVLEEVLAASDLEPRVRLEAMIALGYVQRSQTRYDEALQTYRELANLAQRVGDQEYDGAALFNIGTIFNELDQYELALDNVLRSKQIFEAIDQRERLAYACYSAGLNAMYLGRWQFASEQYGAAIRLFELLGMDMLLAHCYWGQGFLNLLLGDWVASEAAYRQAIARIGQPGRGEPILHMDSWWQLGFLCFAQGRHPEALDCYGEAALLAAHMGHEHRASIIHYNRGRALQALGQDAEATTAYEVAMEAVEALRGAQQSEHTKIGVLGTAQQVYEAAALHALALGQDAEAFDIVERARARAFLDSLAARAPELFARFDHPTVTLAEVQAALPAGALLLAYYTTGVLPTGEHFYHTIPEENAALKEHLLLPPRTVLFAITRDSLYVHRIDLNPNLLSPQQGDPRPGRHLVHERRLAALYERLLGPVAARLASCASLFVVPHGPLHYVPFMALRSRDGTYLVRAGGPAVAIAPSTTILVRNCLGRPAAVGGEALAVGYNGRDEAALRFAEPEARLVARALGGRALTGEAARAEALLSAGPLRALHIAGHAAFRPDAPLKSALELAGGDRLTAHTIMGAATRAELVVLSACTSGLSHVVPGDELLGLQRAWLYAGAAAVVCALWEAADLVTLLVMERFYAALAAGQTPGPALRDAVVAVRGLTGRELRAILVRWQAEDSDLAAALPAVPPEHDGTMIYADPIHWAPFMLIGRA